MLHAHAPRPAPTPAPTEPIMEDSLTRLSFQLDAGEVNARFAGLLIANAMGYFADAGIDMEILPGGSPMEAIEAVVQGHADLACADQSSILQAQANGAPVVAIATMLQSSPYALVSLPGSNAVSSIETLRGKSVGVVTTEDAANIRMNVVQSLNEIDVDIIEIATTTEKVEVWERVVSGELDALQGNVLEDPFRIAARFGTEPTILPLTDLGFQGTAQTIIVSNDTLETRGDLIHAALEALFEGWDEALACPDATAELIADEYIPNDAVYSSVDSQKDILQRIEPFIRGGTAVGAIDPVAWDAAALLMMEHGSIGPIPDLAATINLDFFCPS